ncbi:GntR family transcriptional regulator [Bosea sp. F3-2]|uniref:GntR family transcriptional regulator n=1 Tax=Bosea sp. F3-2 TaxID=2599640 RepID=UPI001655815C|nr:GntR family transcriptional regulator [Bosea sp. F3-2]
MSKHSRESVKIYESIKEAVLCLELRPGSVIDEADIAARINVSRTPVREAIIQLIADDLVIRDGRSARVAPLDFDEVPKLYDALLISSRMVHRLAAENRTQAELKRIEAAMEQFDAGVASSDGLRRSELNVAFHLCIADAAHNAYFQGFYTKVLLATNRLARACFSGDGRSEFEAAHPEEDIVAHMAETARQHRLMYEAIADRDIETSDRMAVMHEALAKGRLRSALFRTSRALDRAPLADTREQMVVMKGVKTARRTARKPFGAGRDRAPRGPN